VRKQRIFDVNLCISQGMNGPKQLTTKIMKQTSETTRNMGGTVLPIGTGWPCHFVATHGWRCTCFTV